MKLLGGGFRWFGGMLFPTVTFAVFFAVTLTIYWALRSWRNPVGWRVFLILASFVFYCWWDERFMLLLAGSTLANWGFGWLMARVSPGASRTGRGRAVLVAMLAANLGLLGWFKYYGFFATEVRNGLASTGLDLPLPLLEIALPVGISFFTFQGISYVIDIWRGTFERPLSLLDFAVFQSFFAHLVAGPIVRASELAPQIRKPLDARQIDTALAATLILAGLFKKVVISTYLSQEIVDPVFADPSHHTSLETLFAVYAYAIQIFADFSGYTDIAIGCALLMGFRFPQNFDRPYSATSLQDFWRRWHMSLSRWLRDYLYIGLGGNRGSGLFTARNLALTMVLGGLWHGAAWTFVAWGALHGAGLVAERYIPGLGGARGRATAPGTVIRWLITFHVVCAAWVFFRAETFGSALDTFTAIGTGGPGLGLVTPLIVLIIVGALAFQVVPRLVPWLPTLSLGRLAPAAQVACVAGGLVLVDALGPEGVAPFIYFRF